MPRRHIAFIVLLIILGLTQVSMASTIKLAWDAVTTNVDNTPITDLAGYRVTFCTGASCTPVTDISPDLGLVTTYLHTGLTPGTIYRYKVRAINTSGNPSADSNIVQATAPLGDLVAHWFTQESGSTTTATDCSWFGRDGTLYEGTTADTQGPTWVTGKINTALHCDGSNDNVQVAHDAALDITGDMTVALWLRLISTTNVANNPPILTKESAAQPTPWHVELFSAASPHLRWYHHTSGPNFDAVLDFTSITLTLNTWVHVAFVRTVANTTVTAYRSGASTQTLTYTNPPQGNSVPILFCAAHDRSATRYANVDLDEVRIYDYALSQTEITRLALAPGVPTGVRLR